MTRFLLIPTVVILAFYGCGGDSTTSTDGGEETPLAVDTLGADGGTFEIDDFALTVPAGAFDADAELRLYEVTDDHGFAEHCVSRFFRLEGVPETFSESLTVRVRYTGTLEGECFIAHGKKDSVFDDYVEMSELPFYILYPASESSGDLEAVIPPRADETPPGGPGTVVGGITPEEFFHDYFFAVTDYERRRETDLVSIAYPPDLIDYVDTFIEYIKAAHDTVVSIGMGYDGKYWDWPVEVVILEIPRPHHKLLGISSVSKKTRQFIIHVNEPEVRPGNLPAFRVRLAKCLVEAAQSIPDPERLKYSYRISWDHAVRAWIEKKFVDPGSFTQPKDFKGNEMQALAGLPVGDFTRESAVKHGHGWSAVVEYLTATKYDERLLGNIYVQIQTEEKWPMYALFDLIPDPAYNWWPQFVSGYLDGQIYGVDPGLFQLGILPDHKFRIKSASDTLAEFSPLCKQVSAELYEITPDYAQISKSAQIELNVSSPDINPDYLTLIVYKCKDGVLTHIGDGNKVTVSNIYDLTIGGYYIIVAAVNSFNEPPYGDIEPLYVRMRVIVPPPYNWCRVNFGNLRVHFTEVDGGGDGTDYWDDEWYSEWEGEGGWDGNTFTASWSGRYDPSWGTTSGHLQVTLDPDTRDVVGFTGSRVITSPYGYVAVDSISGNTIEFNEETTVPNPFLDCKVEGSEVCFRMSYTYTRTYTDPAKVEEIEQYQCREATALYATFWYWDGE